jgi:hypothetical protein
MKEVQNAKYRFMVKTDDQSSSGHRVQLSNVSYTYKRAATAQKRRDDEGGCSTATARTYEKL